MTPSKGVRGEKVAAGDTLRQPFCRDAAAGPRRASNGYSIRSTCPRCLRCESCDGSGRGGGSAAGASSGGFDTRGGLVDFADARRRQTLGLVRVQQVIASERLAILSCGFLRIAELLQRLR